jgi:hypothetical protein
MNISQHAPIHHLSQIQNSFRIEDYHDPVSLQEREDSFHKILTQKISRETSSRGDVLYSSVTDRVAQPVVVEEANESDKENEQVNKNYHPVYPVPTKSSEISVYQMNRNSEDSSRF